MTDTLAETPASTAAETPTVETPAPSTDATKNDAPPEVKSQEPTQEPTEAEKVRAAMQKRIDKLTQRSSETDRKYQEAISKLTKLEPPIDPAPKQEDYASTEEFLKAQGAYEERQKISQQNAQEQREANQRSYQEKLKAKGEEIALKEVELRKTTPDYDETVQVLNEYVEAADQSSPGFTVFRDVLMSAPDLPALSYHLGKNPDLCERLSKMEPAEIAWTLIREAVKLESAPKPQAQPIAKPPSPVTGQSESAKDPEDMTQAEWLEWRNKSLKKRK